MVEAQLAERLLLTSEVCGSNPVISKLLKNIIYCFLYWKGNNKEKEAGHCPFFNKEKFTQDHLWKCFVLCKLFFAAIIYYFYWVLNFSYLFVSSVIKFIYDKRSAVLWCWACSCGSFNTRRMWKNCQTSLPRYCSAKYQIVLTISDMLKM